MKKLPVFNKLLLKQRNGTISSAMGIKRSPVNTDINNVVIRGVSTPSQTNNPLYVMNGEVVKTIAI